MRTVLLAGAFGQGNPGDEAHLEAFIRHLDGWDVVATTSDARATERDHACRAVVSGDAAEIAREASRSDGVVFAGGTIFKLLHPSAGRPPHDLLRRALVLAGGARLLGKPVCMLGVGAGHLDGAMANLLVRAIARRAALLVLRDEESASLLATAGLRPPFRIGTDPAWALFDPPSAAAARGDDVIVALSHLAGRNGLAPYLTAALAPLVADGLSVKLQPWQSLRHGGDDPLAREVAASLGAEIIEAPRGLIAARDLYASSRLVVGLRFHASMAAAAAGTPFVTFGHEPKLIALARRLGQRCVRPELPPSALTATVREALAGLGPHHAAVADEIGCAKQGFDLLRLLLDGPDAKDPEDVKGLTLAPSPAAPSRSADGGRRV
jgi:polysaccharide pyruvyl transferase WcaK-like protein